MTIIIPFLGSMMTAAGAVNEFFRAEQPIKMGLFMIVPRKNDAFGFGEY